MRSSYILTALVAVVATVQAQSQSFLVTTTRRYSSIDDSDIQPTATETVSGPIQTGQACSQVADFVLRSRLRFPSVEAEVCARLFGYLG